MHEYLREYKRECKEKYIYMTISMREYKDGYLKYYVTTCKRIIIQIFWKSHTHMYNARKSKRSYLRDGTT